MYQKPEAEDSLSPPKEGTFMDRIYTKIEAFCVEADKNPSLLFQEAGKYFENQVSSAGATMRKVCSELIRDLLPEDECKHVEKCQCKCDASKKRATGAKQEDPTQPQTTPTPEAAAAAAVVPQDHPTRETQLDQTQQATPDEKDLQAAASPQVEESDTVVEAGDQVAQWYITDEYKRSSGIVETWDSINSAASNPIEELDSDWEIL